MTILLAPCASLLGDAQLGRNLPRVRKGPHDGATGRRSLALALT